VAVGAANGRNPISIVTPCQSRDWFQTASSRDLPAACPTKEFLLDMERKRA